MSDEHLASLTHVRLRAAQGDVSAARRMLRAILDEHPDYLPALTLLERLSSREPSGLASRSRQDLVVQSSPRERIRRLESWLERISRQPD